MAPECNCVDPECYMGCPVHDPHATPDRAAEPFYTGHMVGLDAARAFVGALGRGSAQSLDANLLNVADNSDAIRWLRRALLERLGNA